MTSLHIWVPGIDEATRVAEWRDAGYDARPFEGWNGDGPLHPDVKFDPGACRRRVGNPMGRREYGCLVSHWLALALAEGLDRPLLVCESDAIPRITADRMAGMLGRLPAGWGIFYPFAHNRRDRPPATGLARLPGRRHFYGNFCYAVAPRSVPKYRADMSRLAVPCDLVAVLTGMVRWHSSGNCAWWDGRPSTLDEDRNAARSNR